MTRGNPTGIGAQIRGLVGSMERANPDIAAAARVKEAWRRAADARVRSHVTAVYVVPGTGAREVVVYTDTALWASELSMQSELMRVKLNLELARMAGGVPAGLPSGEGQVAKIRFEPSRERYIPKERRQSTAEILEAEDAARAAVEPVALSPEDDAGLRAAAASIEDDRLRGAAYGAAKASLEWRRGLDAAADGGAAQEAGGGVSS